MRLRKNPQTAKVNDSASKSSGIFSKLWGVISAHPIGTLVTALGALAVGWAVADTKKRNYEKAYRHCSRRHVVLLRRACRKCICFQVFWTKHSY